MSITRLQQARQMYAMGQRVAKTLDGSRPGYRGDGGYQGGSGAPGSAESSGGGKGGSGNNNGSGGNGGGNTPNPHTASGYSKTSTKSKSKTPTGPTNIHNDDPNAPEAYEIIGGKKFDVTPETRDERERAEVLAQITNAPIPNFTPKGIEYFKDNKLVKSFAPNNKPKFNFLDAGITLGLTLLNPALGAKYRKAKGLYNTAKFIGNLATDVGLTDKNVVTAFTDNFKSGFSNKVSNIGNKTKVNKTKSKTKSTIDTNKGGEGDGIASLENQAGSYDEYVVLLQKLQSGNISDAERTRYNVLKNMLGI